MSNPGACRAACAGVLGISGGEAATFGAWGPRGLVMVGASLSRAKVKERLAVAAAEQEDEPLQITA